MRTSVNTSACTRPPNARRDEMSTKKSKPSKKPAPAPAPELPNPFMSL